MANRWELGVQDLTDDVVRRLLVAGEITEATTLVIRTYGREISAWLARVSRRPEDAREAFSIFLESLWRSLAKFRWQSSLRTWLYHVARTSALRVSRRKCLEVSLDEGVEQLAASTRTATKPWLTTDVKLHFSRLREGLSSDERMILSLRVDRQMDWLEIAQVLGGVDRESTDPTLHRRASNLRKQFERIKARLRMMGVAEGLIPSK